MLLPILLGYLAGSVPFAYLLARRSGVDVRLAGSGNVGAAYVFRNNCITAPVVSVSAASFGGAELAPEALVAAFGSNLTTSTQTASSGTLPTQLAGASVRVKDSLGADRLAPLAGAAEEPAD